MDWEETMEEEIESETIIGTKESQLMVKCYSAHNWEREGEGEVVCVHRCM